MRAEYGMSVEGGLVVFRQFNMVKYETGDRG